MKINRLNFVLVLGVIAIMGILVVQLLWMKQAWNVEGKKFSEKVHISLIRTLQSLYSYGNREFPLTNPINKISNDYYIVNVNNDFEAEVLEYCLKTELERAGLITDFEYAIYKCESDEMVYGNYVSFNNKIQKDVSLHFPKQQNLVYYFAVRFPNESNYLIGTMKFWLGLSCILVLILLIYLYSIFTILQQKKYSNLQRDFIDNMTHEFKTPLSSILIASNYLKKQDNIRSDEKLLKYTDIIIDQSDKLNKHIEQVLNIARWDSAPLTLKKERIEILKLIESVIENIKLKYPSLNAEIKSFSQSLDIEADRFHLSNLIYNLLDNSIKYCDKDPHVKINLSKIEDKLKIEFSDNGIGIPSKDMGFVFEKFYRIADSKINKVTGFGLGLYYVKKICLLHNWTIQALNNSSKEGLTISLVIPKFV